MAAGVSIPNPPATLLSPDAETREKGLKALRLELGAQTDPSLRALLLHEIARHHERRDDLAAAARDELAATKEIAGFVEPLESLIDIATRSRSKANLAKLLERLSKLSTSVEDKVRASVCLAATQAASGDLTQARATLEMGLEEQPTSPVLWLALEATAAQDGDRKLLLKAALGRAAHARNTQLRCLLLERVARLQLDQGDTSAAFETLKQSASELPSFRVLYAWEQLALRAGDYFQAALAASQIATIIRAGLEEPEEKVLYEVPDFELNEARAVSAQIRAIVYCLKQEDRNEALIHAGRLLEAVTTANASVSDGEFSATNTLPDRAIALALLGALQRDLQEIGAFAETISKLLDEGNWTSEESGYLATLGSLASARIDSKTARQEYLDRVGLILPSSRLALILAWHKVEQGDSDAEVLQLIQRWGQAAPQPESAGFSLAECLLFCLSGEYESATSVLSEVNNAQVSPPESSQEFRTAKLALQRSIAELTNNLGLERAALLEIYGLVRSENDRESIQAELLRLDLLLGIHESHPQELRTGSPWSNLLLGLISAGGTPSSRHTDDTRGAAEIAERSLVSANADAAVSRAISTIFTSPHAEGSGQSPFNPIEIDSNEKVALEALRIFLGAGLEQLGAESENATEGVMAGVRLGDALTKNSHGDLALLSRSVGDKDLRSAWLLSALLRHVDHAEIHQALQLIDEYPELGDVDTESLFTWLSYRQIAGNPKQTHKLLQNSELAAEDRKLDQICLERRFGETEQLEQPSAHSTQAEHLLSALRAAIDDPHFFTQLAAVTELFSPSGSRSLHLARAFDPGTESELLAAASAWAESDESTTKLLTVLLAARKAGDSQAAALALFRLAELNHSDELLVHIDGRYLPPELEARRKTRLLELATSGSDPASSDPSSRNLSSSSPSIQAAWMLAEEAEQDFADAAAQLAQKLDPSLKDVDAQLAQLSAGFEYLCLEKFEEAVAIFEPLLDELGTDFTYCQGLRFAAANAGRYDLEAGATSELARHAPDNRTSSAYWERAGIIYQDHLADPHRAEQCFNAALARTPGSPTAFERVYRFASARKDRQRQVELIDARLDTAESETLRIELYWEKARFCRMLGKCGAASRALGELLELAPDHLPSLALAAELHLVEGDSLAAVEILARVARHPDTPDTERRRAGLFAADLFEQLQRPRDAIDLLQDLEGMGITTTAGLLRKARSHARSGDWSEAYNAFATLNDEQDTLAARLESARMMLAIQRDHIKQPDELKDAARRVLRDDPEDADAVSVVLQVYFPDDERRRLLGRARESSRQNLLAQPLNPTEIIRYNELSKDCGDETRERIALGVLGLTGKLTDENVERLARLHARLPRHPSGPFSPVDIETSLAPELWGAVGEFLALVSPFIAARIDPNLQALGVSALMRVDEFSESPLYQAVAAWMNALGLGPFELYLGGHDPNSIRAISVETPTLVIGKQVELPLTPVSSARLVSQLYGVVIGAPVLLNQAPDLTQEWLAAARLLAQPHSPPSGDRAIDEKIRLLSDTVPRASRERLIELHEEMSKAGVDVRNAPFAVIHAGARAATLAYGEPSILRKLPQLLPEEEEKRTQMVGELIRFTLSDEYLLLRRKIGLESAS